jgi:pimeloyl-ACP methyl ester carboxylesterase
MLHDVLVRIAPLLFGGNYGRLPVHSVTPVERTDYVGGKSFQVLEWPGEEPALVCLHGVNNSAWTWMRMASLLSGKRRILAPSLRGHGRSYNPLSGYSLDDTRQDLDGLFECWKLSQPVDLLGHSWGGLMAMDFAGHFPARVRSLALADPVPPKGLNPLLRKVPALMEMAFAPERADYPSSESLMAAGRLMMYLVAWDELDRKLWEEKYDRSQRGFTPRLKDSAYREILDRTLRSDVTGVLGNVKGPVLLLRPLFTVSFIPGELCPLTRTTRCLQRFVRGDHTFIHANPIDTAARMREFLDKS